MVNKKLTEIICIIDESGSMALKASDAIGGFNDFLKKQKKLKDECKFTLVLFDTEYKLVYDGADIKDVAPLNSATYSPGGCTALLDAVGKTIDTVGARYAKTAEKSRPGNVLVCIITDGEENSSREYKKSDICDKITHQTDKYSWKFIFLGANQDAFAEAGGMGITMNCTMNYDMAHISGMYSSLDTAAYNCRTCGGDLKDWQTAYTSDSVFADSTNTGGAK